MGSSQNQGDWVARSGVGVNWNKVTAKQVQCVLKVI